VVAGPRRARALRPTCTAAQCQSRAARPSVCIREVLMTIDQSQSDLDVTVITGMSGAGRSEAADVLEDLGFFVIDNLPPALIGKVAELARGGGRPHR